MNLQLPSAPPETPDWGFDLNDFWSLAGRLVPCGPAHLLTAIDLANRFWWWDPDGGQWFQVPYDCYAQRFREIDAWRAVAPEAAEALCQFLSGPKVDPDHAAWVRLQDIQNVFLKIQGFECIWQVAYFYRSLLLDHRWLLPRHTLPGFDEYVFEVMIAMSWQDMASEDVVPWLKRDPVICAMPAMYPITYPDSWKTGIIRQLEQRGIYSECRHVDDALDRLAGVGKIPPGQAHLLKSIDGPLRHELWVSTVEQVGEEIMISQLDAPDGKKPYVHFTLPTPDRSLEVAVRPA